MSVIQIAGLVIAGLLVVAAAIKLFAAPLRLLIKLILSVALGFLALIFLDLLGAPLGLDLGVNLVNAATVGILGLPGVALLLIVRWALLGT